MKISLLLFCSTLVFAGKKGNPTPQPPRLPTPLPPRLPPIQPPIQPSAPPTNPSIFTQQCKAPRIRKEWRELTSYQQDQFFKGMNLLKNTPSTMGHSSLYNDYAYIHNDYSPYTHDTPQFFVWHRHFLLLFEKELQKVLNDPSFAFPYWEWTIDSQAPEESPLMQPNSFGTLGGRDGCVRDGAFANWRIPGGGCLQRAGTSRMDALYSPEQMQTIVRSARSYEDLRNNLEPGPHGAVHVSIGGTMVHMLSPADPLFWMHHSNVDRYYALWQEKNPSIRNDYPTDPERTRLIYYTDSMVSSVFKTDSVSQCYVYSRGLAQRKSSLTKREVLDDYGTIYNEEDAELIQDFSQVPDFNSEDALHDPQDRDDQNKLRSARPLPESWISMNKMDIIKVRRLEYHHALINIKANELIRLGKYTSQVSLQNKKMDFASAVHSLDIVGDFIKKFDIHHFKLNAMKKAKESVKNEIPVGLDDLKDVPL